MTLSLSMATALWAVAFLLGAFTSWAPERVQERADPWKPAPPLERLASTYEPPGEDMASRLPPPTNSINLTELHSYGGGILVQNLIVQPDGPLYVTAGDDERSSIAFDNTAILACRVRATFTAGNGGPGRQGGHVKVTNSSFATESSPAGKAACGAR